MLCWKVAQICSPRKAHIFKMTCVHTETHTCTVTYKYCAAWKHTVTLFRYNSCVVLCQPSERTMLFLFSLCWIHSPSVSPSEHSELSLSLFLSHTHTNIYKPGACNYLCVCERLVAVSSWWLENISPSRSGWHLSAAIGVSNSAENKGCETH